MYFCSISDSILYVFPAVFLAVFFVHIHNRYGAVITVTVPSRLLRVRRRRRAVSATFAARSLLQVCHAAAQAQADRSMQSDQVCAAGQRRTCTGAPWLRAEAPWQSWLAVDHEETTEQRRPSDVEMMSSLSNRQPLPRKRSWGFLNQLHIEIKAQKINANGYNVTEII